MHWTRRRVGFLLAWIASLAAANYVGGVIGFYQGHSTAVGLQGTEAFVSTTTLRLLRQGRLPELTNLLESRLDSQIAESVNSGADKSYRSPYNLWMRFFFRNTPVEVNAAALSEVLKYREEHPPVGPDATINAALMTKLATYRNAKKS